jgi:hypothetical protein
MFIFCKLCIVCVYIFAPTFLGKAALSLNMFLHLKEGEGVFFVLY